MIDIDNMDQQDLIRLLRSRWPYPGRLTNRLMGELTGRTEFGVAFWTCRPESPSYVRMQPMHRRYLALLVGLISPEDIVVAARKRSNVTRRSPMSPLQRDKVVALLKNGTSPAEIAKITGATRNQIAYTRRVKL